jgi:hypothetical protein
MKTSDQIIIKELKRIILMQAQEITLLKPIDLNHHYIMRQT